MLVVDDIQVGNGRTGYFFSFERAGIVPDMVVLSKSISGFGMPMSILLLKPEFDLFRPAEHNGTFRGNNLAFVGSAASLKYFEENRLDEKAKKNGEIIEEALKDICSKYSFLDYRGIGMIWGIDFSRVDTTFALKCVHEAFEKHLICEVAGRKDAVLKIMPPLTIEEETLREGLAIVKEVVDSVMA